MSRHDPVFAMKRPWVIRYKPDRPGGGYLLTDENGYGKVRVYGSRADVDLILNAVNNAEAIEEENWRLRGALERIVDLHSVCSPYAADIAYSALDGEVTKPTCAHCKHPMETVSWKSHFIDDYMQNCTNPDCPEFQLGRQSLQADERANARREAYDSIP